MSGVSNALSNALSGLEAFETGIAVVSNNIANANTAGYASESANIQTAYAAPGQVGQGVVNPVQIVRAASGFAASQLRGANSANAAAQAQSNSLSAISGALTNNGNIQTAISQFFSDISSLSANPSSVALRQTVLSDAQSVTTTFQAASSNISTVVSGAQESLSTGVTAANGLLAQLQGINKSLAETPGSPSLLDQQQAALNSLSQYLPVSVVPQSNGSVVLTSGGTVLLDQSGAQDLASSTDSNGNPVITAGAGKALVTLLESDGSLGGALGTITAGNQAQQSLNMVATSFATQVNQSQAEGLDGNGNQGTNLFTIPAPTVTASSGNQGAGQVTASITNTANLPADGGPLKLTYNSSTSSWSALDQTSGQTYQSSGVPPQLAGMALSVSGNFKNGDSFILNPSPNTAAAIQVSTSVGSAIAASDPYVATPGALQPDGSISNTNGGTITAGADSVVTTPASNAAVIPEAYFSTTSAANSKGLQINFTSATTYTVSLAGSTTPITSGTPPTNVTGTLTASGNGTIAIQYPSGSGAAGKYWQLPISGTPSPGDTLTLEPGGVSSGSNAQRMAGLWTAAGTTTSGTLQQSVVGLATGLGANASAAQALATATSTQVATATSNLATVAGVDTDKQAVLMSNYSQAYQAAAQVISSVHSMFESLLSAV